MSEWHDIGFEGSPLRRQMTFDESEQKLIVKTQQPNMDEALAFNRALHNAERASTSLWKPGGVDTGWVKVASIPQWLIESWMKQGINYYDPNDTPKVLSMLNSSDYTKLRTAPGRL